MATIDMGQKLGGGCAFFLGTWVPIEHKVAWDEAYLHTKWYHNPSSRLATMMGVVPWLGHRRSGSATIDMGQKLGGDVPFFLGKGWVPIEHKVAWAEAYLHTKWHLSPSNRLATADIGRKGGCAPLGEGQLSPNTMSPGPRPNSLPNGVLIHPAVWPQQTWPKIGGCCTTF